MTDKEKIKEEIERRIVQAEEFAERAKGANDDSSKLCWDFVATQNKSLLQFINSLPEEPASEDLEEAIENWIKTKHFVFTEIDEVIETAKHFAEWQKRQMKEALQTEHEKGRFDMREEMMKDAIEGWCITDGPILNDIRTVETEKANLKIGNKVKIIILKPE